MYSSLNFELLFLVFFFFLVELLILEMDGRMSQDVTTQLMTNLAVHRMDMLAFRRRCNVFCLRIGHLIFSL
jgi:hypothetical protein